jgi:hypothetical protein
MMLRVAVAPIHLMNGYSMNEIARRRAHLASGGTIENYDRTHYNKEQQMIKVTLTTVSGTTRGMEFDTKEHVLEFIELMTSTLHAGVAVCIDAPLIGIHNGWIQGKAPALV